jgi:heme exporter protein B
MRNIKDILELAHAGNSPKEIIRSKAIIFEKNFPIASLLIIQTLVQKEWLLERRQQHSFFGGLLYVACTVFVLYLSMGQPETSVWNGLFWMNLLFIGINTIAKSFLQESKGRMLYYYSIAGPVDFIISKIIYNLLLMSVMSGITLLLFRFFLGQPFTSGWRFWGCTVLGSIGISLVFTFLSAIAEKANQNAALMAILGFPIIIPQLLLLIRLSKAAFGEIFREQAMLQMIFLLLLLDIMVIALSTILYPFLWKD